MSTNSKSDITKRELVEDTVIADFAADGRMVAIEILDPKVTNRLLSKAAESVFSEFDISI